MADLDCVHSEAGEHSLLVYFYLQAMDDVQASVTSDSVRVSEDVLRSLSNPVPKSLTQSHTSTDSTSEIGRYSCRYQQTEVVTIICHSLSGADQRVTESEESHSQSLSQHMPHSSTDTSTIGRYSCRHNKQNSAINQKSVFVRCY